MHTLRAQRHYKFKYNKEQSQVYTSRLVLQKLLAEIK